MSGCLQYDDDVMTSWWRVDNELCNTLAVNSSCPAGIRCRHFASNCARFVFKLIIYIYIYSYIYIYIYMQASGHRLDAYLRHIWRAFGDILRHIWRYFATYWRAFGDIIVFKLFSIYILLPPTLSSNGQPCAFHVHPMGSHVHSMCIHIVSLVIVWFDGYVCAPCWHFGELLAC